MSEYLPQIDKEPDWVWKPEAILNSIFDNTSLGYTVLDADLNIVSFNKAAYSIASTYWGIPPKAGNTILDLVSADRRHIVKGLYKSVLAGEQYTYEIQAPIAEDSKRWYSVNVFPIMLDDTKRVGMTLTMEDITERKRTENIIGASGAKYRTFFENSMDGLLLSKRDGEILEANPAACALFRMTEDEIKEMGGLGLVNKNSPGLIKFIRQRERTGRAKGELIFQRKDGTSFPGILSSVVYKDAFDEERTSSVLHDITKRKVVEEIMSKNNSDLRKLTGHLHTIREQERILIAREIHEGLGQQLSAAKMGVSMALKKMTAANLADDIMLELLSQLDDSIKTVRRITADLRPVIIDHEGLASAMRWHLSELEKVNEITCHIDAEHLPPPLDKEASIILFRIFEDTVDEIILQGQTRYINVELTLKEQELRLVIASEDTRIAAVASNPNEDLIILSMQERAAMIGGSYSIARYPTGESISMVVIPFMK